MSNVGSEELIEEVHKFDSLFHKCLRDYRDNWKKANSWVKVAKKFKITPSEAEKRVKNIRTAYDRFLKKTNNAPSGSGRDDLHVPSEFQNMGWLAPYIDHRPTSTNID